MGRVNAALPTDLPDSILLTLVRSYPKKVCGEPCPEGQRLADGDRCQLMARAAQPKAPQQGAPGLITDWTTKTTVTRAWLVDQGQVQWLRVARLERRPLRRLRTWLDSTSCCI